MQAGTIATPYTPKTRHGHRIIAAAVQHGSKMDRYWLASAVRRLRDTEGRFAAQHCLAWLVWVGGYPVKIGGAA